MLSESWNQWGEPAIATGMLIATLVLAAFTIVLARATARFADATFRPLVTATIEPNLWSKRYCDIIVENNGSAPAYDITLAMTPEPDPPKEGFRKDTSLPLRNISVLRPGQKIQSFLTDVEPLLDKQYKIQVRWKRRPSTRSIEEISYDYRLPPNLSFLEEEYPEVAIAKQLKQWHTDWKRIEDRKSS